MLSFILFLPLLVAFLLVFIPSEKKAVFQWSAVVVTGIQLIGAIVIWFGFDGQLEPGQWNDAFQFVVRQPWIRMDISGVGALNVDYFIGVDGISLSMVLLSCLVLFIGALSSVSISHKVKGYYLLYLVLSTTIVGCFVALDFFLFYVFFEFMLLPMFFLIGIWGGKKRQYASIKFFIYTLVGSLLILVVMIGLFLSVSEDGMSTFSFIQIMNPAAFDADSLLAWSHQETLYGLTFREWAFWSLLVGFMIKLPAIPVHTWLPDAHVEAPTSVSVVLAGILLKIGGYGLYRLVFAFFPTEAYAYAMPVAVIGVITILYGGLVAMAQTDLKRMVAYSSVSHMGFVLLGVGSLSFYGAAGGIFQMFSHGILSPALFLIAGVLYDRTGNRLIENFSGLASQLPKFTFFVGLFFFASLGLPGLSGFVGELLVLLGAFKSHLMSSWVGPVAVLGILTSAVYLVWTLQRMFFGTFWVRKSEWMPNMKDLTAREWVMLLPLGILALLLGILPFLLLGPLENTIQFWVDYMHSHAK